MDYQKGISHKKIAAWDSGKVKFSRDVLLAMMMHSHKKVIVNI